MSTATVKAPSKTTSMLIYWNASLKQLNTFGIEANAKMLTTVESVEDLQRVIKQPKLKDELKLVLGGGSNLLLTQDFPGVVIHNNIMGVEVEKEDDAHVWVRAGAGELWHDFVLKTLQMNLSGIENLSLIPGRVGAAPMQNIGAYGVELKETFDSLQAVDIDTGAMVVFNNEQCEFGYRDSVFKNKYKDKFVITSVTFKLNKTFTPRLEYGDIRKTLADLNISDINPTTVSQAVIHIRQNKLPDPSVLGNAGSFFKNPVVPKDKYENLLTQFPGIPGFHQHDNLVKIPAAWMIEQCGWKGKRVGDAATHEKQPLVLVNHGQATGRDILTLAQQIHNAVLDKFGVEIIPEVNII